MRSTVFWPLVFVAVFFGTASASVSIDPLECYLKEWDGIKKSLVFATESVIQANLADDKCVKQVDDAFFTQLGETGFGKVLAQLIDANTLQHVQSGAFRVLTASQCAALSKFGHRAAEALTADQVADLPLACFNDVDFNTAMTMAQLTSIKYAYEQEGSTELLNKPSLLKGVSLENIETAYEGDWSRCRDFPPRALAFISDDLLKELPFECLSELDYEKLTSSNLISWLKLTSVEAAAVVLKRIFGLLPDNTFEEFYRMRFNDELYRFLTPKQLALLDSKAPSLPCSSAKLNLLSAWQADSISEACARGWAAALTGPTPFEDMRRVKDNFLTKLDDIRQIEFIIGSNAWKHLKPQHWQDILQEPTTCSHIADTSRDFLDTFPADGSPECFAHMGNATLKAALTRYSVFLPLDALSKLTAANHIVPEDIAVLAKARPEIIGALGRDFVGTHNVCAGIDVTDLKDKWKPFIPLVHKNCVLSVKNTDKLVFETLLDYPPQVQEIFDIAKMVGDLGAAFYKSVSSENWKKLAKWCKTLTWDKFSVIPKGTSCKDMSAECLNGLPFLDKLATDCVKQLACLSNAAAATIKALAPHQKDFTVEQIKTLGENASGLAPETIKVWSVQQVGALGDAALAALPPSGFGMLTNEKFAAIPAASWKFVRLDQFQLVPKTVASTISVAAAKELGTGVTDKKQDPKLFYVKELRDKLKPEVQQHIPEV